MLFQPTTSSLIENGPKCNSSHFKMCPKMSNSCSADDRKFAKSLAFLLLLFFFSHKIFEEDDEMGASGRESKISPS